MNKLQRLIEKKVIYLKARKLNSLLNELFLTVTDDYDNKENIEQIENEFDDLAKILRDPINIKNIQNFFDYLYKVYPEDKNISKKITGRIFLSAFIMYGYPEITLDFSRKKLLDNTINSVDFVNFDVYYFSKLLIINFIDFMNHSFSNEKLRKLIKSINIYSNVFYLFLCQDKLKQINKITFEYYQISKTLKEIKLSNAYEETDKEEIAENLVKTMNGLKEMIQIINPRFDLKNLIFYEEILDRFENVIHKSYWDILRKDMDTINRDNQLKKKLEEIYETYKSFNIKKMEKKVYLVNEFISSFNLKDFESWIDFTNLCVNIILELQSPARNDITRNKFHEIKYNSYSNLDDLIIILLEFIFQENQMIFREVYNTRLMINMGINPFVKK
jgi:hypothetical protein